MTARDEAVKAMIDAAHAWRYGEIAAGIADEELVILCQELVAAVMPFDVQLAIERGALEVAYGASGAKYINTAGETLYRVVEP